MSIMKPGVRIERVDAAAAPRIVLRTDIAAFVGIAGRGPLDTPVAVDSMRQFSTQFGSFIGGGYLAYAVRGFFDNGGMRCWVVRVAQRDLSGGFDADDARALPQGARAASIDVRDTAGRRVLRLAASSAGVWGDELQLAWSASGQVVAISPPSASIRESSRVDSTAGFAVDELVRIEQGALVVHRVIAAIDASARLLHWVHPDPLVFRPTDRTLAGAGFDTSQPIRIVRIAYGLVVRERGAVVASYRDLHLVPAHPRYIGSVLRPQSYWTAALGQSAIDPGTTLDGAAPRDDASERALPRAPQPVVAMRIDTGSADAIPLPVDVPFDASVALTDGADGLAQLSTRDFIGEPWDANDDDYARARKSRGLQSLAMIEEIALLAMPDLLIQAEAPPTYRPRPVQTQDPCVRCPPPSPPRSRMNPVIDGELPPAFTRADIAAAQAALIQACDESGDRFCVLGLPFDIATAADQGTGDAIAWRDQFDARCAALVAPWLRVDDPFIGGDATRLVPACGHVMGAIARTELALGVQQAPGNVPLTGVIDISRKVDDDLHGTWNAVGIDVLRAEFGRTPMLGGARTLSTDPQWRYINVVRLMLTIRKAADIALRWVVFEPNDENLRAVVRGTLLAILRLFHARGAFAGSTEDTCFFVRCDDVLNPPEARDAGQLLALVGFAPATPAEFIVLRVGRRFDAPTVSLFDASMELQ